MNFRLMAFIVFLTATAPSALADATTSEQYFALYLQGSKIGHAIHTRQADGKTVTTTDQIQMTMGRGGTAITAKTLEKSIETIDGRPLGFDSIQDLGLMAGKASGSIASGKLTITTEAAGQKNTQTMDWPAGAVLAEGLRLKGIKEGLKAGTTWNVIVFSPALTQTVEASVVVGEKKTVDLLGRMIELTEVTTTMVTPSGSMVQTAYVSDDYDTMKMTTSAMGMVIEMLSCPKEFALAPVDIVEFFSEVTVKSPERLPSIEGVKSITYHITPAADAKPAFLTSETQSLKTDEKGAMLLVVKRQADPPASKLPYSGNDAELLQALKRSQYVESDDPCVVSLAKQVVRGEKDAWKAAKKIEKFVSDYVSEKNLSVGYATAAEVARSRQGDCTEHAVLTAAMCKAAGIPARVVAGLVYADSFGGEDNIFGPHAWAEVNIAGKWYGLDATGAPRGYAPDHIAISAGDGSPAAFLGILNTIGNFTMTKLEIER